MTKAPSDLCYMAQVEVERQSMALFDLCAVQGDRQPTGRTLG